MTQNSGQAQARTCPNCGAAVPVGAKFCGSCGASIPQVTNVPPASSFPPAMVSCPVCGKTVSSAALTCPNCGQPLRQQAPPSAQSKWMGLDFMRENAPLWWWLIPMIFSIVGGIVAWYFLRHRYPGTSSIMLEYGLIAFIFSFWGGYIGLGVEVVIGIFAMVYLWSKRSRTPAVIVSPTTA